MIGLTVERLRKLVHYDSASGLFTWRIDRGRMAKAGTVAGRFNYKGYRIIKIDGRDYMAGRLAWLYIKGEWPKWQIDHKDMDKDNNRFSNLREATGSQNQANRRVRSDNELGIKGVRKRKGCRTRPFEARISVNSRLFQIGMFATAEEAHAAYAAAVLQHYGEFARFE